MNNNYTVLIVDDHPIIIESFEKAFQHISFHKGYKFNIKTAVNTDIALELIKRPISEFKIDLLILDIGLPKSKDKTVLSGEDLGVKIKEKYKDIKIIVATAYNDTLRLSNIFKSLNPEGLIVKEDVNSNNITEAIQKVINDSLYYSSTVLKFIKKAVTQDHVLDKVDRQILYEMSLGAKMKDLQKIIPLSEGGIEKRKRKIKAFFNIEGDNLKELIVLAKEKGFI